MSILNGEIIEEGRTGNLMVSYVDLSGQEHYTFDPV